MLVVRGNCPACGQSEIYYWDGLLRCEGKGCPNPDAAQLILNNADPSHIFALHDLGRRAYHTIQHPLLERVDGSLFNCQFIKALRYSITEPPGFTPGKYRVTFDGEAFAWRWESL